MTTCQACTGRAELFLCSPCTIELRAKLIGLAIGQKLPSGHRSTPWLDALADAATGRAKLGDRQPRGKSETPGVSINQRASRLLADIGNQLSTWVREVCESRGIPARNVTRYAPRFIGPLPFGALRCNTTGDAAFAALWLAQAVFSIAASEDAGLCFAEVGRAVESIEKLINRPTPPRFVGPCDHFDDDTRKTCGRLLYARRDAIEITCAICRTVHNVNRLTQRLEKRADVMRFTATEILEIMRALETPLPERTWRRWRTDGRIKIRGYKRPDNVDGSRGAIRLTRHSEDDEPVYRLSEVRRLRARERDGVSAG